MSKICGIYAISDVETGNIYIGSSNTSGIAKRWSWHLAKLRGNTHGYSQLQDAWNDSENRIKFEVLEQCLENISEGDLTQLEQDYINYFKLIDGITVINKVQDKIVRTKGKVKDTSNMSKAQQGSNNGHNTKLSESDVIWIRDLYKTGEMTIAKIAEMFKISPTHCSNVIKKIKWPHI